MKPFGVAVKEAELLPGVEKIVFEYSLSAGATHGAITQQWHAGKPSGDNPGTRMRIYIDGESVASVDYPIFLAHGAGPAQLKLMNGTEAAWSSLLFARTHDSGWSNSYLIPFGRSVRVTITCPVKSKFWYMVRGLEEAPLVVSGLTLPTSTRLRLVRNTMTVPINGVVPLANLSGTAGLLRQVNIVANSTQAAYQEGCVSAIVDGSPLWISSGMEDYALGAYFHSMPAQHLRLSGFSLGAVEESSGHIKTK